MWYSISPTSPYSDRLRDSGLAARALALGVPYEGADFRLDPPRFETISTLSVAVIGTGKRVGKTAVAGHVAGDGGGDPRRCRGRRDGAQVRDLEVIEVQPTVADLLEVSPALGAMRLPTTSRRLP